jgi:tRNA(Ile)-lysidine synthase
MKVEVQPGTYVIAVSGGVDSMVLLDILRKQAGLKLVVAHFDHGIRHDSSIDRELVQQVALKHGLSFVHHEGKLGPGASEDTARKARYEFLHSIRRAANARAILTAHHHDDVLETAVINMLRGTNRKGITSLKSQVLIQRPLIDMEKQQLRQYAQDQGLVWREDSTNNDLRYLRNQVRYQLLPKLSANDRNKFQTIVRNMHRINEELDGHILNYLHLQPTHDQLDRKEFIRLPHVVAREIMAGWLRKNSISTFDQKMVERLVVAAKTFRSGGIVLINNDYKLRVTKGFLALERSDR